MIGKAKNPRCFRGVDQSTLPVVYRNQKNAWVNVPIFLDWFHNCFVLEVRAKLQNLGQENCDSIQADFSFGSFGPKIALPLSILL